MEGLLVEGEKKGANPISLGDGAGRGEKPQGFELLSAADGSFSSPICCPSESCPSAQSGVQANWQEGNNCVGMKRPFIWYGNCRLTCWASQTPFLKQCHLAASGCPQTYA